MKTYLIDTSGLDYEYEEAEDAKYFDLRGTLRQDFGLEAALLMPHSSSICSPISALLPIGKLALGAEGKTLRELQKAIGVDSDLSHDYDSPSDEVASQTHGMIPSILSSDDISKNTSLVIVNAIYFAGKWKYPFSSVSVGTFHSAKGTRQIPMMSRTQDYAYTFSMPLMAQIVRIPYHGDKASFLIVLPKERNGLDLVLQRLNSEPNLLAWAISKMEMTKVMLTMPKFKIESEWDLRDLYQKVGISTIFRSKKSELNNIVKSQTLVVSAAVQKAVIDVNELGTEAGASSAISIVNLSLVEPIILKADHPFLFFVMGSNQQLFCGIFNGLS
ncbi:PREDICTED: antichymotrypsin-2-like [Papilio polytes]|uniref:antichymotrypsin-2-like n=1 Tax=Papilio polytes TaxID=76194 RepID=UPI000675FD01|nr:PREDICTED: antichymotrypsin-2-like [Papilio polytes]